MARPILSEREREALYSPARTAHFRLYVGRPDGVTWTELTKDGGLVGANRLVSARIVEELDTRRSRATITLKNPDGFPSLVPEDEDSELNQWGGSYQPLLWRDREIQLRYALTLPGQVPREGDFRVLFHGYLGQQIEPDTNGNINLFVDDLAKPLVRIYCRELREYGSKATPVLSEIVAQSVIDDYFNNVTSGNILLKPIGSPAFQVENLKVQYTNIWDVIQNIADHTGWVIRFRYEPETDSFQLYYYEPDRTKTIPDWVFDERWTNIQPRRLDTTDKDIRNRIIGTFRDSSGTRQEVVVTSSLFNEGFDWPLEAEINERNTKLIKTETEMTTFLSKVLSDLEHLNATTFIPLPFWPHLEIHDLIEIRGSKLHSKPKKYAIEQIEHDIQGSRVRTSVIASGKVIGAHQRWIDMSTQAGASKPTEPIDESTKVKPQAPTNLAGSFAGTDAIFTWDKPTEKDYARTKIEVWVGGVLKRTTHVDVTSYTYSYSDNVADNGAPGNPSVTVKAFHINRENTPSDPSQASATNSAPPEPTGFTMASTVSQIQFDIDEPSVEDLATIEYQLGLESDYGDASTVYAGTIHQGVMFPAMADATHYGRVRFKDKFGQTSDWVTDNTVANMIDRVDMAGEVFQITPSSDVSPTSGDLTSDLWDFDTSTGCVFPSAPTIEYEFPMTWLFSMVRFYPSAAVNYYVQAYDDQAETWVDVLGSSGSQQTAEANAWNIKPFDNNKFMAARRLRIVFASSLTLYELKFWTMGLADELLAQTLTLTGNMKVQNEDGSVFIDPTGIDVGSRIEIRASGITAWGTDQKNSGDETFKLNAVTGSAFYAGSVRAGELILPVEPL